jgi:hypothetical protein
MPDLVKLLQNTKNSSERTEIRKALLDISGRSGARCIPHLKPLTRSPDNEIHIIGLRALAIVGGSDALAAVNSAIAKAQPDVRDEAVRILSTWPNNWPEDSVAGKALLTLAKSAEKRSHQVLALRGYFQYIRGNKKLSSEQKVAAVMDMLTYIKRPEEKRQAVAVLGEAPSADALKLLLNLAKDTAVVEEAYSAMVRISNKDIPGVPRDQRRNVLQMVVDKSGNNGTKQRARKILSALR